MSKTASRERLGSEDGWVCGERGSVVAGDLVGMAVTMLALWRGGFEGVGDIRLRRSGMVQSARSDLILFGFKGVVLLLNDLGGTGKQFVKEFEESGGIE